MKRSQLVLELIETKAQQTSNLDDHWFEVDDIAAGNVNDAYYAGLVDGQVEFARHLLEQIQREGLED